MAFSAAGSVSLLSATASTTSSSPHSPSTLPATMTRVLLVLSCLVAAVAVPSASAVAPTPTRDASSDIVANQFASIKPVTAQCSAESALSWLGNVGEIFSRIASGGLPSLPPNAVDAVKTLGSQIISSPKFSADTRVIVKTTELLPSIWSMGFWYAPPGEWRSVLSTVVPRLVIVCKTSADQTTYDALVNATSLIVRFTKDNVFLDGVDRGNAISHSANRGYVEFLGQWVGSLVKGGDIELGEASIRAYMNTIPSKRDGMDMSVAYPVYVDTAKYKDSDAAALRAYLSKLAVQQQSSAQ